MSKSFHTEHFEILLSTLGEVEKGYDVYAAKASRLLSKMAKLDWLFNLLLLNNSITV